MLKTEGEARGFQHFPADIKSVTSLLVPFLKQYHFSNTKYQSLSVRLHSAAYNLSSGEYSGILPSEGLKKC